MTGSSQPAVSPPVRRAQPGDALAIAEIHVRGWDAAYRGLIPDEIIDADARSVQSRRRMWEEGISRDARTRVWVAEHDHVVAGFCCVAVPSRDEDAPPGTAEVAALYVDPAHWRRGTGRALLEAASGELKSESWRRVTLWVLATNERARGFYERAGFRPDGGQRAWAQGAVQEARMRKDLNAELLAPQNKGPAEPGL